MFPREDIPAGSHQNQTMQCPENLHNNQDLHLRLYRSQLKCKRLKLIKRQTSECACFEGLPGTLGLVLQPQYLNTLQSLNQS